MKRWLILGLAFWGLLVTAPAVTQTVRYLNSFSAVVTIADTDNTFWCQTVGGCASVNALLRVTAAQIKAYVLPNTAVTPGSYTNSNITVQADGRVTAASNGSAGSATGAGVDGGTSSQTVTGSTVLNNATRLAKLGSGWATGTITLPAISAVSADSSICIDDAGSFVSGSATLTVAPNAVDALSGGTIGASSPVYTTGGLSLCWRVTATHNWALEAGSSIKASDAPSNQFANGVDNNTLKYAQPSFSNLSGAATPTQLPNPAASAKGGVQSKDCTGTGHILSINTDSTVTCSADSGGGGGFAPAWTTSNTNPTLTCDTSGTVTTTGKIKTIVAGNITYIRVDLTLGSVAGCSGSPLIPLPNTTDDIATEILGREAALAGVAISLYNVASSTSLKCAKASGDLFTLSCATTGYQLVVSGHYGNT